MQGVRCILRIINLSLPNCMPKACPFEQILGMQTGERMEGFCVQVFLL